ncbi:coiled-coil domain-containing protein 157-like, partial [Argonauta hians]
MAYLLGSDDCLNSLKEDIFDLQTIIGEYISRLGPLNYPSWKFPSKKAGDIDIEQLLGHYLNFPCLCEDNEEAKQIAHIAFYDLLIDRMVYLFHVSNEFSKNLIKMLTKGKNILLFKNTSFVAGRNSVGLVARRSWNLNEFLLKSLLQFLDELKDKKKPISPENSKVSPEKPVLSTSCSSSSRRIRSSDGSLYNSISKDVSLKSTQTLETAFLPCESCSVVQKSFKKSAFDLSKICQKLNLPSNVNKLMTKPGIGDSWMSFTEITKYSYEQEKDFSVVCQHIETMETESKLKKTEMASLEKKCKSLESNLKATERKLSTVQEQHDTQQKQNQKKLKEVSCEKDKFYLQLQSTIHKLELCQANLLKSQKQTYDLQSEKIQFDKQCEKVAEAVQDKHEVEINRLKLKIAESVEKCEVLTKTLAQEQAKNKSIIKHSEAMQKKQTSLLERVEQLSEENSNLQDEITDLQDSADENLQNYENLIKEKEDLEQQLKKVKHEPENLAQSRVNELTEQLKKMEEREILLVQFPDLNGPVLDEDLESGDLTKDMQLQLKSNLVRIELLEKQNKDLLHTLKTIGINTAPLQNKTKIKSIPLWNIESLKCNIKEDDGNSESSAIQSSTSTSIPKNQQFNMASGEPHCLVNNQDGRLVSKSLFADKKTGDCSQMPKSTCKSKEIPPCNNTNPIQQLPQLTRSLSNIHTGKYFKQLAKAQAETSRPISAASDKTALSKPFGKVNVHVCKHCDKMYLLERE